MITFVVVQDEIWSSDGGVHTLKEAYQMREELKLCISQIETRPTKRAVDLPNESRQPSWADDGLDDAVIGSLP